MRLPVSKIIQNQHEHLLRRPGILTYEAGVEILLIWCPREGSHFIRHLQGIL